MDRQKETADSLAALSMLEVLMGETSKFCYRLVIDKRVELNESAKKFLRFFVDHNFTALLQGVADAVATLKEEQICMGDKPPSEGEEGGSRAA